LPDVLQINAFALVKRADIGANAAMQGTNDNRPS
jgi:hypothetical protein